VEIKVVNPDKGGGHRLSLPCPHCGRNGTFEPISNIPDLHVAKHWLGQRRCPNPQCLAHLFYIADDRLQVLRTYPALRIDFESAGIPDRIKKTLLEALTCHAEECYVAAAIMIRRCLEELCEDRGAQGGNLKERIASLQSAVVLPNVLFDAMDELRLLGNDAAHIEAKVFDQVGKPEVEAAIEVTKEILKAVYQLDSLVKKLQALKARTP
jgi:Domain of unknown function (DUF4145)